MLVKARASDPDFGPLFDGDTGGRNDLSADMALMNKLAFWFGNDPARMERVFSSSALAQRAKWTNRADYRKRTIDRATNDCEKVYDPEWRPPEPGKNGQKDPPRKVTVQADDQGDDEPINRTELGNAKRLVKLFGHKLRYCQELGYWLVYDSKRWSRDRKGEVWRCARRQCEVSPKRL